MKILQVVLAKLIRSGRVTVEIPGLEMDMLKEAVKNEAVEKLKEIEEIAFQEDLDEVRKVMWIQVCLERE